MSVHEVTAWEVTAWTPSTGNAIVVVIATSAGQAVDAVEEFLGEALSSASVEPAELTTVIVAAEEEGDPVLAMGFQA